MIEIFKALSDETRLRILSLLWDGEMCVCEIEKCLNLTQSNASRHLTALKKAGFLSYVKQAQWAYYKLNEEFLSQNRGLCEYLGERLKKLESYETDCSNRQKCKREDMCK
ncbi:MAG: metalloregulator ArsR/SmtB family transcription factor [Clostridia bacterium]|nr:metalloregulator ArsR/SmtB family transcription factor [Clostridia bacterium]